MAATEIPLSNSSITELIRIMIFAADTLKDLAVIEDRLDELRKISDEPGFQYVVDDSFVVNAELHCEQITSSCEAIVPQVKTAVGQDTGQRELYVALVEVKLRHAQARAAITELQSAVRLHYNDAPIVRQPLLRIKSRVKAISDRSQECKPENLDVFKLAALQ